jgi:type IV pilus assembly protein PilY1
VWAYIPTSLLPHLQWLPDPQYIHSYYVDMKPLVAEIKVSDVWRTVLVAGLRLGGRPIETPDTAKAGSEFYFSEIVCFDITDPEVEPELLWRYSALDAGLTVGLPNFVSNGGDWYVVIPSGPRTDIPIAKTDYYQQHVSFGSRSPYNGYSTQNARLIVLDAGSGIPAVDTTQPGNQNYLMAPEPNSFFNNPFLPVAQKRSTNWSNHVLYYGLTVSRNPVTGIDSGAVYRLQMVDSATSNPLDVSQWQLKKLYQTARPVTGAVNSTYDSAGNLWVLFGTGKLWSQEDIRPCDSLTGGSVHACEANHDQYIFGIKEDLDANGFLTFKDLSNARIIDVSGAKVFRDGTVKGLAAQPGLTTGPGGTAQYYDLAAQIKASSSGGYKRKLESGKIFYPQQGEHRYEMVISQPKLVTMGSGLSYMAFSSFEPKDANCGENGYGFLYLVDTYTGLPSPDIFDAFYTGVGTKPSTLEPDEVPGVLTSGTGTPTEAYISASAGGITASTSAPDMSIHTIALGQKQDSPQGITSWKEVLNYGFELEPADMRQGLALE